MDGGVSPVSWWPPASGARYRASILVGEGGGREDGKKLRAPGARPAMRRQFAIRRLPRAMPPSAIPWLARATPKRGDRLGRLV
jgi:hypothetical protein